VIDVVRQWPILNAARNYGLRIPTPSGSEPFGDLTGSQVRERLVEGRMVPFHLSSVESLSDGISRADIPDVHPPFRSTWNEFQGPSVYPEGLQIGVRVSCVADTSKTYPGPPPFPPEIRAWDAEGIVAFEVWGASHGCPVWICTELLPMRSGTIDCGSKGSIIANEKLMRFPSGLACSAAETAVIVVLFAWALLECRNVETVEIHPSTRRTDRRSDPMRVVYRELKINTAPAVARRAVGDEHGHGMALHIVRGHFKEYDGKGLFGRYKGRWWFGQHVAGDRDYGTVLKSYALVGRNQ